MKPRILTVSSAYMEFALRLDKFPDSGEIAADKEYEYIAGGRGVGAAVALAKLGADSIFCTKLGTDGNGAKLRNYCENIGIDTRFISMDRTKKTGMFFIVCESNGNKRIVRYPGANDLLLRSDVEEAFTCYPDALLLQFDVPADAAIAATQYANEQDIPVFVDAGPLNPDINISKLERVEVFSPNADEVCAYTGIYPSDINKCIKACMTLEQKINAKYYVLKLGSRGCFLYDGKYYKLFPAIEVDTVDHGSAGEAFTAALALEYMRTENIKSACEFANVVGAITVTKPGTARSIPSAADVKNFLEERERLLNSEEI